MSHLHPNGFPCPKPDGHAWGHSYVCDHSECTGNHTLSGAIAGKCPAVIERHRKVCRERSRERYANDPEYRKYKLAYDATYRATAAGMLVQMRHYARNRGNR